MPLYVPKLARKLQCLYQRHADVNTHERLAEYLNIAPNNISIWINGNEVRAPALVPNRHIKRICDLFEVQVQWLELECIEEFKTLLSASTSRHSPWQKLSSQAVDTEAIRLVRRDPGGTIAPRTRGLVADEESRAIERFHVGDRLYISVNLDGVWAERVSCGQTHVVLFSVDQDKTICLCPSLLAPNPHLTTATFYIPSKAPECGLKVAGPTGEQSVVALLTTQPFPTDLYVGLRQESNVTLLDRMAIQVSQSAKMDCQILKKTYEVL